MIQNTSEKSPNSNNKSEEEVHGTKRQFKEMSGEEETKKPEVHLQKIRSIIAKSGSYVLWSDKITSNERFEVTDKGDGSIQLDLLGSVSTDFTISDSSISFMRGMFSSSRSININGNNIVIGSGNRVGNSGRTSGSVQLDGKNYEVTRDSDGKTVFVPKGFELYHYESPQKDKDYTFVPSHVSGGGSNIGGLQYQNITANLPHSKTKTLYVAIGRPIYHLRKKYVIGMLDEQDIRKEAERGTKEYIFKENSKILEIEEIRTVHSAEIVVGSAFDRELKECFSKKLELEAKNGSKITIPTYVETDRLIVTTKGSNIDANITSKIVYSTSKNAGIIKGVTCLEELLATAENASKQYICISDKAHTRIKEKNASLVHTTRLGGL